MIVHCYQLHYLCQEWCVFYRQDNLVGEQELGSS